MSPFTRALTLATVASVAWALPVFAQTTAPNATAAGDDLEVPASPAPSAAAPAAVPAQPPSVEDRELKRELADLRQRVESVERARVPAPAPPSLKAHVEESISAQPVDLERSAISRPVPTGTRISGYLQAEFAVNQSSENQLDQSGAPLNQNRFSLRRGRLRLDRGWEYANATLELDANTTRGVNVGIRRAEGSLLYRGHNGQDLPPVVMLTMGVTDIPFGFEILESARVRPFMERSLGSSALFPTEMDVGVKLSGAVSFLRYAFAISNGEPVDNLPGRFPRDPNSAKDYSGRVGIETQPLPALAVSAGSSFYQGTGFHAGAAATKPGFTWLDINEDRAIQPNELQAVPGTAATPSLNFKRWAYALDLEVSFHTHIGSTRLVAEGFLASNLDRGYLIADPGAGGNDVREAGGYLALTQEISEWSQVGFRAGYYDPNADFFESRRGHQVSTSLGVRTLSPLVALRLRDRARLSFQYDFVQDHLAKDSRGVPTDAKNNQATVRLQVDL
ncbi:MAG: hypothetical protein ABI488_14395 [Polyangiaceae bacterium]